MKLLLVASLLLVPGVFGHAQTSAPTPVTDPASAAAGQSFATIHIFRQDREYFAWGFLLRTLPIYFGERVGANGKIPKIAGIRNKEYFVMSVPAGKYLFDTQKMKGKLELEVAAGGEYYLAVDHGYDCPGVSPDPQIDAECDNRNPGIEIVQANEALPEIAKLMPISPKNNKAPKLIVTPAKTNATRTK
jgi:hypothetical protein